MARLVNLCDRINSENLSPLNELLQIRNVRALPKKNEEREGHNPGTNMTPVVGRKDGGGGA